MSSSKIHWPAPLASGLGIATWWAHAEVDPGTSAAGVLAMLKATLDVPGFLPVALSLTLLLAGSRLFLSQSTARRCGVHAADIESALAPLLWGLGLPLVAPLLDVGTFWCTAPPLAALGLGLGTITSSYRLVLLWQRRSDTSPAGPSGHGIGPGSPVGESNGGQSDGAASDTSVAEQPGAGEWDRLVIVVAAIAIPILLLPSWPQPGGDEPQYLVYAHSIWFDTNLDLADDYAGRAYEPFHPDALAPHTKPGRVPGSRHSMHGIGLPLLLLPGYVTGRRLADDMWMVALPRASLAILYGLFAWTLFGFVTDIAGRRAARAGTTATVLLAPLLFAPLHLFPTVPAMLLACAGYRGMRAARDPWRVLASAVALAVLPWIGVKFIPLAAMIVVVGLMGDAPVRPLRRGLIAGATLAVSLAGHSLFMWSLYGTFSPASIYLGAPTSGASVPAMGSNWGAYLAAWPGALATVVGYFLDQKEGLLAYGPHFVLVAAGLPWLWRRRRHDLLSLAAVGLAYVGPYALSQQLSGQGPPVRPLMAILWVLAPGLGVALAISGRDSRVFAAVRGALLSLAACLTLVYASWPALLPHDYPVKSSRLLRAYAPNGADWWRLFPQWVNFEEARWGVAFLWALLVAMVLVALMRVGSRLPLTTMSRPTGPPVAWFSAATVAAALCCFVLVHHSTVVVTGLHRRTIMGSGLTAWVAEEAPVRIWAETDGVWMRPGRAGSLVLTSNRPLESAQIELGALLETEVSLDLHGASLRGTARPEKSLAAAVPVLRGWRSRGSYAYHCRLSADRGLSPALSSDSRDERLLGVFLRFSGLEYRDPSE